jgi:glycosyltransferase involved in cell wall biosynthesis
MQPKKKVLLSVYACEPDRGSEEGTGWQYATLLPGHGFKVHCLTQVKFRHAIERAVKPGPDQLTFHYIRVPRWVDRAYGTVLGIYVHYLYWQWAAYRAARRLDREVNFDLVHHATYGSAQLGSFLYKLGKPFIFGPVGGGQRAPWAFRHYFGKYWSRERIRDCVSVFLQHFHPGFRNSVKRADRGAVTNFDTFNLVRALRPHRPIEYFFDSGLSASFLPDQPVTHPPAGTLKLLWVGRLLPRKGLELSLHALSKVDHDRPVTLTIVGGEGEMRDLVPGYLAKYGLTGRVNWVGQVPYSQVMDYYRTSDVFLITSLRDSGPMQLVEAMAYSLPVITLLLHGQREIVSDDTGIRVPITTPEQVTDQLARAIEWMSAHPDARLEMGRKARERAQKYAWPARVRYVVEHWYGQPAVELESMPVESQVIPP